MITHKDGFLGFYRGVFTNLMTTVCGSLLLVSYDFIKERYDNLEESKRLRHDNILTLTRGTSTCH